MCISQSAAEQEQCSWVLECCGVGFRCVNSLSFENELLKFQVCTIAFHSAEPDVHLVRTSKKMNGALQLSSFVIFTILMWMNTRLISWSNILWFSLNQQIFVRSFFFVSLTRSLSIKLAGEIMRLSAYQNFYERTIRTHRDADAFLG